MSQNKTVDGRLSCRVDAEDMRRLKEWADAQADAAGVPRTAMGISAAVRMAIRAFLDGKTRSTASDEGYAQGVRIAYGEARRAMTSGLHGSLAGLNGAPEGGEKK